MADDTSIANMALQAVGTRSTVMTLSEGSPESNAVQLIYANQRNALIREYRWGWSARQGALNVFKAQAGTPENPQGAGLQPPWPWRYSYVYPVDCLDCRFIVAPGIGSAVPGVPLTSAGPGLMPLAGRRRMPIKFEVAGDRDAGGNSLKVILCDAYQAQLNYSGAVFDPNVWDDDFVAAFVGRLAKLLVNPLSGNMQLAKLAIEAGQEAELRAAAASANEDVDVNDWEAEAIAARTDGGDDW